MRLQFVTGANKAFFPTLLVLLQSFAEQVGEGFPFVCDYGLATTQRELLRRRGLLLERPPALGPLMTPLREKAILREYFRHSGIDIADSDAVVWLDGDLTLVDCPRADIEAVVAEMAARDIVIAASQQNTIAGMLDVFRRQGSPTVPFEQLLAESGIDPAKPYYSTGVFLCRSPGFLDEWSAIGRTAGDQPVLDQNVFNAILQRDARAVLPLDIDLWQAQGDTLDRLRTAPDAARGRGSVHLDGQRVKILHATSPTIRHLLIGPASFSAGDLLLEGAFKLLRSQPLMDLQLALLSRFLRAHRTELLETGLCRLAPTATEGYSLRITGPTS
jgi:hypothetical protein